jgi:hypothetical protein
MVPFLPRYRTRYSYILYVMIFNRVVDPHGFNADPYPVFFQIADPDPDTDPDLVPNLGV